MKKKAKAASLDWRPPAREGDGRSRPHFTPIRVQGRVVGQVEGRTFRKTVRGSKHRLRRPPAWALDVASLDEAEALGARFVEIHDVESDLLYRASIADIRQWGFVLDRGHGLQIALRLEFWATKDPRQLSLPLFLEDESCP